MSTKLTLSLNKDIIEQAKVYAKMKGVSLSFLIENYLQKIIGEYTENSPSKKSSIVDELSGIISLPTDYDYKEDYRKHLIKKHK